MAKIPFDDVVPPNKRSIRNIPIPNGGKRKTQEIKNNQSFVINKNTTTVPNKISDISNKGGFEKNIIINKIEEKIENQDNPNVGAYEYYYPKNDLSSKNTKEDLFKNVGQKKSDKKFIYGGLVGLVLILFVFVMMTVFSSATINIIPRTQFLAVSMDINAVSDPISEGVKFEVIKISKSKTAQVKATGEEDAEIKASGRIIIYNNFSSAPQRLINRTRFESPNGLIYRIAESVVVPGKKSENGVETPGSIEVEVFADESGEKYNIDKVDFTIPGFKDDKERYSLFYARSATPMTGGFVGKRKTVLESEKQNALSQIETELRSDLIKDAMAKIPDNLVYIDGLVSYDSFDLPQSEDSSSVLVGKEVVANVVVLNKEDLSKVISSEYMGNYPLWNEIPVRIYDFSGLKGELESEETRDSSSNFDFKISGNVSVVAHIDSNSIKDKLLGTARKQADFVMDEYPGILNMTAKIRPVWKKTFPDNPEKIKVLISIP